MDDVNRSAPGNATTLEIGTLAVAQTGGVDQGYLHHRQPPPGTTRMPQRSPIRRCSASLAAALIARK
jgi:hypothetical protein